MQRVNDFVIDADDFLDISVPLNPVKSRGLWLYVQFSQKAFEDG